MRVFDLSLPLHKGMVVWPGDEDFEIEEKRGTAIVSEIEMSTHTGTHIDAPRHFLFNNQTVDKISISKLIGKCKLIEIKDVTEGFSPPRRLIEISDFAGLKIKPHAKILFKTRNSKLLKLKKFTANYVSLSLPAAKYLVSKKIDLVGIDYYGIEAKSAPGHPVHKTLLRAGVVIVEGLDLAKVKPGAYNLAVLPLKIVGSDGSPARAVLWK